VQAQATRVQALSTDKRLGCGNSPAPEASIICPPPRGDAWGMRAVLCRDGGLAAERIDVDQVVTIEGALERHPLQDIEHPSLGPLT